jgi:hypothetical protein
VPDEASLLAKALEIRKHILSSAGREAPIFALENEQWGVLPENSLHPAIPTPARNRILSVENQAWKMDSGQPSACARFGQQP